MVRSLTIVMWLREARALPNASCYREHNARRRDIAAPREMIAHKPNGWQIRPPQGAGLSPGLQRPRHALPAEFSPWNTIWKRIGLLSQCRTFEALFQALAALNRNAVLIQTFDSTSIRAHVSAAGEKRTGKSGPRGFLRSVRDEDPYRLRPARIAPSNPTSLGTRARDSRQLGIVADINSDVTSRRCRTAADRFSPPLAAGWVPCRCG